MVASKVSPGENLEVAFGASGFSQNMQEQWLWDTGGSLKVICYKLELSRIGQGTGCGTQTRSGGFWKTLSLGSLEYY